MGCGRPKRTTCESVCALKKNILMSFRRQALESFASFGCRLPGGRKLPFFRRPRGTAILSRKQARAPRRPGRFTPCPSTPRSAPGSAGWGRGRAWSPCETPPPGRDWWPPLLSAPNSGMAFVTAGSFLPGSGRAPPAAAGSAGPTAHPYLGRVRHSPRGIC